MYLIRKMVRQNSKTKSYSLLSLQFSFIAFCFSFTQGFSLLGPKKAALRADSTGTIVFQLDPNGPQISEKEDFKEGKYTNVSDAELWPLVVGEAIALWEAVPGTSLRLKADKSSKAVLNSSDNYLSIVLSPGLPFSVAASAQPVKDDDDSYIKDCDIQVGGGPTPLKSLVYTVAHEMGHCLGFGHNHVDYKSIMGYSSLTREFRLGLDDMAALIYLYPAADANNSKNSNFAPCGSVAGPMAISINNALASSTGAKTRSISFGIFALLSAPFLLAFFYRTRNKKVNR